MWCDSWEEAERTTKAHGDRVGWPDMAPEDIPSFSKYINEHSLGQITNRFIDGFRVMWERMTRSYGYVEFLVVYIIALAILLFQNISVVRDLHIIQSHPGSVVFITGFFLGYLMLYAWYTPVAAGNRFILSLFLPSLLLFSQLLSLAQDKNITYRISTQKIPATVISAVILLFLASYVITVYPARIETMFGGR